jgi:probable F420-dependent oxidoreductase
MSHRPLRFGLQAFEASSAEDWFNIVRRTEDLGYSTLFTSDHYFGPGEIATEMSHRPIDIAPLTGIAMAAAITKTLRVGCRVFACDFHHPVVLAKETATLDMLSGGRLEVGLGAGWTAAEYDGLGIPMDSAGTRIERLAEYINLMRAHWGGEQINVSGKHVNVHGFAGRPLPAQQPHPPIMIGGGAPRILRLAGREADIVSLNFNNSTGKLGAASVAGSGLDVTREKIGWVREGAGDRFDQIELEIGAYFVAVGDDIAPQIAPMAERYGVTPDELLSHPHGLFGSVSEICDTIVARREELGISYVTIAQRNLEDFAPVVAALAGT